MLAAQLPFTRLALLIHMHFLHESGCDAAARLFDRGNCGYGRASDFERQFGLQFTLTQHPHAVARALDEAGRPKARIGDGLVRLQLAGIERNLDPAKIDHREIIGEAIVKAALGQAHIERHLTALEAVNGPAGARFRAFDAAPRGLAQPGTRPAADAGAPFTRPGIVPQFVQLHDIFLLFDHFDEMAHLSDHAANGRRIFQRALAPDLA